VTSGTVQETVSAPGWTTREGLKRLVARSDRAELEQAGLRALIAGIVLAYVAWSAFHRGYALQAHADGLTVALAFFLLSCLLILRILAAGRLSVPRRVFGIVADNAVITYCLFSMGMGGLPAANAYLFITFSYGFRYGRVYMHACQIMGLAGLAFLLMASDYWSYNLPVGVSFMFGLIIFPLYVGALGQRIVDANKRVDRADRARDEPIVAGTSSQWSPSHRAVGRKPE